MTKLRLSLMIMTNSPQDPTHRALRMITRSQRAEMTKLRLCQNQLNIERTNADACRRTVLNQQIEENIEKPFRRNRPESPLRRLRTFSIIKSNRQNCVNYQPWWTDHHRMSSALCPKQRQTKFARFVTCKRKNPRRLRNQKQNHGESRLGVGQSERNHEKDPTQPRLQRCWTK